MQCPSGPDHRIERGHKKRSHCPIEAAQARWALQEACHLLAQNRPGADRRYVDRPKDDAHQQNGLDAAVGGIGRDGGQSHGPGFWVDPLEGRGLEECERGSARLPGFGGRGMCDAPGKPQKISHTQRFEDGVADRIGVEDLDQARTDQKNHHNKADTDAQHMRNGAAKAEIRTRCHQHQVIRPRRDGGNEGKRGEAKKNIICHAQKLTGFQPY